MSQKNIKEILVGLEVNTRLFDIVGFAQKQFPNQHFCASQAVVVDYHLTFVPCDYKGPLQEKDVPEYVLPLSTSPFEHFLQSIRKNLLMKQVSVPGSFMDVTVIATDDFEHVRLVNPEDPKLAAQLRKVY